MSKLDPQSFFDQLDKTIHQDLEVVKELCKRLGNPQNELTCIHIAGTNGKGSTLRFLANVLECAGYRVGCYVTPDYQSDRNEICIGDKPISPLMFRQGLVQIETACQLLRIEQKRMPSAFEVKTALSFWYFHKQHCDFALIETGMGGTVDATNILSHPILTILTSITKDHTAFLGNTIEEIAAHKAGILKAGAACIVAAQSKEVYSVIDQKAKMLGVSPIVIDCNDITDAYYHIDKTIFSYKDEKEIELSLPGVCQPENAVLAIEAVKILRNHGFTIRDDALRQGLLTTKWMWRFSVLKHNPTFVVDGAHNIGGVIRLKQNIQTYFPKNRIVLIAGIYFDKDADAMLEMICPVATQVITLSLNAGERSRSALELAQIALSYHKDVTAADSLQEALELATMLAKADGVVVAFGSLSYLAELAVLIEKGKGFFHD
ncbi:MAG: bifunctional folylpolyglutamate synthase/dihydrofolate synthase [Clostridium sp.]|jgi:dihydrofolate synthase/folylpolyglutamate synthase|nr:bifunctional folylpolyglutamate synthase/dihydrofolate synthase [Clostridium sp.]